MSVTAAVQSVNKAIGAVVGGGVIALLVGLHVIPASVGNTILAVLAVAGAVLGAFVAPANKPVTVDAGAPVPFDDTASPEPAVLVPAPDGEFPPDVTAVDDDRSSPYPHGKHAV